MNKIIFEQVKEDLCFKAGFCGTDLSNTMPGTCQETALENLIKLVVQECAVLANRAENSETELRAAYNVITEHFGL